MEANFSTDMYQEAAMRHHISEFGLTGTPCDIACCVQVYFDLRQEREKQGKQKEVALVRVEQLAPFPFDLINRELKRYPNAHVMW